MPNLTDNMPALRRILTTSRTIAIVGHSPKPQRPSYQIAQYLRQVGYTVYPVNPGQQEIDGHTCYPNLAAIPAPIDIANIFRQSKYLPDLVDQAIALNIPTVWAQEGVDWEEATARDRVQAHSLQCITNTCIMIVHRQLH